MMTLYGFFNSSTSYRVRIALALKGIPYRYEGVNIRIGEQSSEKHQKLNPSKGVPVLVDEDGFTLNQSMAVLQYLEDCFPQTPLLPGDVKLKAQILAFCYGIACDIHPVNNLRILKYLSENLEIGEQEKKAWYAHWVDEGLSAAEKVLAARPQTDHCFGNKPTWADVCLIPQIANAERFGCELNKYPRLMKIYRYCIGQPAFIEAQPGKQPDFVE